MPLRVLQLSLLLPSDRKPEKGKENEEKPPMVSISTLVNITLIWSSVTGSCF